MSYLVSVIIPVFNRPVLVKKAIDSVLAQTYDKLEIIVIDDGSIDHTGTVLKEYQHKYPDRVFIVNQKNSGQVIARNNGIKASHGELIAFLDSDDLWLPEKLEMQIPLFADGVGLVFCGINEIDEHDLVTRTVPCESGMRGKIYHHLLVKNRMTGGTVVITRDAINKVGLFDPKLNAAENWDLWIRISQEYLVDYVDEPLVNYRKHSDNMSGDSQFMSDATKGILEKHFPLVPVDPLLRKSYDEAYVTYYFGLALYYFGHGEYGKSREFLRKTKQHGKLSYGAYLLFLRTFLGKFINSFITSSKSRVVKLFSK